jgi:putative hydrolase of the HAD superfamily
MVINLRPNSFFVFDLDDTLFLEIDFLKSAYRHISKMIFPRLNKDIFEEMWERYQNKENVFQWLMNQYRDQIPELTIDRLLTEYREHNPDIEPTEGVADFLAESNRRNVLMAIITDGRSLTQRNKLKALNILPYFKDIIISEEFGSEKPDKRNYIYFTEKYPQAEFYFFGDNTSKDFLTPHKLGWTTICIKDSGYNIHKQEIAKQPTPDFVISSFKEIFLD